MTDQPVNNAMEPDDGANRHGGPAENGQTSSGGDISTDRGLPDLGQYQASGRSRAWWLTPLVVVVVVAIGAVWTVHGFLARHDADARARRDGLQNQPAQGRVFGDAPASGASAPHVASAVPAASVASAASGASVAATPPPAQARAAVPAKSYYDAPLIAGGDSSERGAVSSNPASGPTSPGAAQSTMSGAGQSNSPLAQALTPTATPRVTASLLGDRNFILAQGAKIDCAGDTAFDSTEAGITTCTVTQNVYSDNGHVLLIERGSVVNSEYRANVGQGQRRVFLLSARIKTPTGVIIQIDSPAADALGRMGIGGYVNNHWGERVGAAFLLGITQDAIGYLATRGGNDNSSTVFENTQETGNNMAAKVLDSTINIPPTLKLNQAAEFTIVVARDLDFSSVYALQPE